VTLSIAGIDDATAGYFAAKLRHEESALAGPLPATILRATQFHEFVAQLLGWTAQGGEAHVPATRVQTVAARAVGKVLIEAADAPSGKAGMAGELAGPEPADLPSLVRAFVERRGVRIRVVADGSGDGILPRSLLPSTGARLEGPTFAQWLDSDDAARLALPG
jgi:hypothetical protein